MLKVLKTLCVVSLLINTAFAEQNIVIKDCSGNTQLIEAAGTTTKITAELGSDIIPSGSTAVFSNASVTQVVKKEIVGKLISFENISPGEYTLCAEPQKISFQNISVFSGEAAGLTVGTAGLAIAGAAGAGALAVTLGDSSSNSNDDSGPVSSFNVSQSNEPAFIDTAPAKRPGTKAEDDEEEESCFIGDKTDVAPISPFN